MSATSRQIVLDCLNHTGPERVPMTLPEPYPHDFSRGGMRLPQKPEYEWRDTYGGRAERTDPWGNTWLRLGGISKGEVIKGGLENLDDLDNYEIPPIDDYAHYAEAEKVYRDPDNTGFRVGGLPGFAFNIARYLRKLDNFFMDLHLDRERIDILMDRLDDAHIGAIRCYAKAGADAVMIGEDWGTQTALFISPDMWRERFAPRFERLCGEVHAQGMKMLMHSCGKVTDIIPDLIACGVDCLQFDQPRLHGIDLLASYADRCSFWCPVDIQKTLPTEDPAAIEADAREMIEKIGGDNGGFIAGYYGDNAALGLDPEVQDIACRAFVKYGAPGVTV
jgi:hypothetical protein